ncbi:unnamed protein product [Ostreobium quekettii]|uniref:K Homology domain-containing protein n=1 Tax=Ostreobium quekettii TaxID=121088 RepID=A0A8S1J0D1_9CHLO|nr:unnamed protein product [Ostreobium quekettii]|eukprot:evm.model.scf_1845.2 EVM.evm.TU.scf_1845.2   scf_1845:18375-28790(+)
MVAVPVGYTAAALALGRAALDSACREAGGSVAGAAVMPSTELLQRLLRNGYQEASTVEHEVNPLCTAPAELAPSIWGGDSLPSCKTAASSVFDTPAAPLWTAQESAQLLTSSTVEKRAAWQMPALGLSPFIVDSSQTPSSVAEVRTAQEIEEMQQGITGARRISGRAVQLNMTLLVAGFIIGPCGVSIRDIVCKSGASISSCTRISRTLNGRRIRVFHIKGTPDSISLAVKIMLMAVGRYKDLAEGKYKGRRVRSAQVVEGVEFVYRPPPKGRVPHAASIDCQWYSLGEE